MNKMLKKRNKKNENGAIVVEATIALTAYVFAIYIILSIVNICYIQARMGIALDAAAEDISQYSYLYYRFGIDNLQSQLHDGAAESRNMVEDTISGVGTLLGNMEDVQGSYDPDSLTGTFDNLNTSLNETGQTLGELSENINNYADALADDPKGFIIGMGTLAADELSGQANSLLGQAMGKAFVKRNLKSVIQTDPDAFLKQYHIEDGMKGLDFSGTQLMTYGVSNTVQLVCAYEVEVVKLLDFEYTIPFKQCARTSAWGNGVSKIEPEISTTSDPGPTIWDMKSSTQRGKMLVEYEKDHYTYTDSGHGYDAYNNKNGKNEFVTIMSIDTHTSTYDTDGKIASKIKTNIKETKKKVDQLGEDVTLTGPGGKDTVVKSDPDTRTVRIVLVVPDDHDPDMLKKALEKVKQTYGDVVVEVKTGYGSPTSPEKEGDK